MIRIAGPVRVACRGITARQGWGEDIVEDLVGGRPVKRETRPTSITHTKCRNVSNHNFKPLNEDAKYFSLIQCSGIQFDTIHWMCGFEGDFGLPAAIDLDAAMQVMADVTKQCTDGDVAQSEITFALWHWYWTENNVPSICGKN
jgi:hypothetical protein